MSLVLHLGVYRVDWCVLHLSEQIHRLYRHWVVNGDLLLGQAGRWVRETTVQVRACTVFLANSHLKETQRVSMCMQFAIVRNTIRLACTVSFTFNLAF